MIKSINYLHLDHPHPAHLAPPRGLASDPTKDSIELVLLVKNFFLFSRMDSVSSIQVLRYADYLSILIYVSLVPQFLLSRRYLYVFNRFVSLSLLLLLDP